MGNTVYFDCTLSADFTWDTTGNWWLTYLGSSDPSPQPYGQVPQPDDYATPGNAGTYSTIAFINGDYFFAADFLCDLPLIAPYGTINGSGTFIASNDIDNGGTINGGSFGGSGGFTVTSAGIVNGGTFTSDTWLNNAGVVNGGTVTGANPTNQAGSIAGGVFSGSGFTNESGCTISGGTFSGANFSNGGTITGGTFSGAGFTNTGTISGGYWLRSGNWLADNNTIITGSGDDSPSADLTTLDLASSFPLVGSVTFNDGSGNLAAATFGTCELYVGRQLDPTTVIPTNPGGASNEYQFQAAPWGSYGTAENAYLRIPYTVASASSVLYLPVGQVGGASIQSTVAAALASQFGGSSTPLPSETPGTGGGLPTTGSGGSNRSDVAAAITAANIPAAVLAATIDGIAMSSVLECIWDALTGKAAVDNTNPSAPVVTFYKSDNATPKLAVTLATGGNGGTRTGRTILN